MFAFKRASELILKSPAIVVVPPPRQIATANVGIYLPPRKQKVS